MTGYQAGGTPAQALVGDYATENDRRKAYWYRRYHMARSRDEKARCKAMATRLGGWIATEPGPSDPWNNADCRG